MSNPAEFESFEFDISEIKAKFDQDIKFEFDPSDDEVISIESSQQKKQIVLMLKKIHLAAVDTLKLIKHYKKILSAGHPIPSEILTKLNGMANQLIDTANGLSQQSDSLNQNIDKRIQETQKLLAQAEQIIKSSEIGTIK